MVESRVTTTEILVEARSLTKHFPVRGGILQRTQAWVKAVDNVSLSIRRGETLGLVGESGCGKTTIGRMLLRLIEPTSGRVFFRRSGSLRVEHFPNSSRFGGRMQIVFQDPFSSLDPRTPVGDSIAEGLRAARDRKRAATARKSP